MLRKSSLTWGARTRGRRRNFRHSQLRGLRSSVVPNFHNYLVFYFPADAGVDVVRVLHGARLLRAALLEPDGKPRAD